MRLNTAKSIPERKTHNGAKAATISKEKELRRSVMACLLWENEAYESGKKISDRIAKLADEVKPEKVAAIAREARSKMQLRHVPLLLARVLARKSWHGTAELLADIIQRPDEITEFMAIYWKDNPDQPIAAQVKKGLAKAFNKFNEYQLAKWNGDGPIKLRDVMFLVHAKPKTTKGMRGAKAAKIRKRGYKRGEVVRHKKHVFTRLADGTLETPDTWEVALSGGADKKATFTRLIKEGQLGGLALLRNLRGMQEAGVGRALINDAIASMETKRILPFRFIAAARHAPQFEPALEGAMLRCAGEMAPLKGRTIVLVDVSGSMDQPLSAKSDMARLDAACGVAMIAREICDDVRVFTFSDALVEVPPRQGFALRDAITHSQKRGWTFLGRAVREINRIPHDRLIVVTDEQSNDPVGNPAQTGYMINVASAKNGVGYGAWTHIDGFSEAVLRFIREVEDDDEAEAN